MEKGSGYRRKRRQLANQKPSWRPILNYDHQKSSLLTNNEFLQEEGNVYEDDLVGYDDLTPTTPVSRMGDGNENENDLPGIGIGIRGEEIGIILGVILLWIGAIALFFNRWGKIRMLEPYQPKFCEEHRLSCPISEPSSIIVPRSFSKVNLLTTEENQHFGKFLGVGNWTTAGAGFAMSTFPTMMTGANQIPPSKTHRLRQNSLFSAPGTGQRMTAGQRTHHGRRTKSAIDLPTLILSEEFYETLQRHSRNGPVAHV